MHEAVANERPLDRADGAHDARMLCRQEADERHSQERSVQIGRAEVLREGAGLA